MAKSGLDEKFVQAQKQKLEELQGELRRVRDGLEEDARDRAEDEGDMSEHDAGDMSRSIFNREMDATVGQAMERRLEDIERALEKVEEGTYGICDDTGEEIPRGRLEAVPEAIRTVEAQQSYERERRPPV
jgi:DnaK suppressor protein